MNHAMTHAAAGRKAARDVRSRNALRRVLSLLVRAAPAASASAWVPAGAGAACIVRVGNGGGEALAQQLLRETGEALPRRAGSNLGIRLVRGGETVGALVLSAEPGQEELCRQVLRDLADAVTTVLEADRAVAEQREPGLAAANERLLVRLGFDLHDGPLQQVYVLAQDVRLLREQVAGLVGNEHRETVVGRFADLQSQLRELHQDLRDLAHSLEPRSLLQQPLPDAVGRELAALNRRTGISTSIVVEGAFDALSASQRIALLRVLQEALSNIRQHSGSREVAVLLRDEMVKGVCMEIRDDGHGFDPASVVPAQEGESGIGLVGMRERLRLLGGHLEIESAPGGPTVVRATLPRWLPLAEQSA
jgi:signal transduction histidine kinase